MGGLSAGTIDTHAIAIWRSCTISSSMLWYLISSTSNTSAVHSSLTTDWTHLGKSIPSSPNDARFGALPVSSSSNSTPKLYTSDLNVTLLVSTTSGAR
uniref:Uncharacterized protein n=1 Tax=Nelumbo nucifera TaxID=4432 RepID=A0A822Y774_NELNU|nr:TPA_asm: hypothetical protein HUJ06_028494 [Nelumbo nucifera]